MPNTLAHLAINGIATQSLIRGANLKWILLGAIIPDAPWILQRIIKLSAIEVDLLDLRLYITAQASLFFCAMIAGSLALLSKNSRTTFAILFIGSVLHLLTDALQTKWANGVHLFAPFDWEMLNLGLFWPESVITVLLTLSGIAYIILLWKRALNEPVNIETSNYQKLTASLFLLIAYFSLPMLFFQKLESHDAHYIATLRNIDERSGKYIEFDRANLVHLDNIAILNVYNDEKIILKGLSNQQDASVSVRGTFKQPDKLDVSSYHIHHSWFRNMASYLGLSVILIIWLLSFFRTYKCKMRMGKSNNGL